MREKEKEKKRERERAWSPSCSPATYGGKKRGLSPRMHTSFTFISRLSILPGMTLGSIVNGRTIQGVAQHNFVRGSNALPDWHCHSCDKWSLKLSLLVCRCLARRFWSSGR